MQSGARIKTQTPHRRIDGRSRGDAEHIRVGRSGDHESGGIEREFLESIIREKTGGHLQRAARRERVVDLLRGNPVAAAGADGDARRSQIEAASRGAVHAEAVDGEIRAHVEAGIHGVRAQGN